MGQKETLTLPVTQEVWKLLTDVTYAQVPFWFDQSWRPLKMDLLLPKHQENHKPLPLFVWLCGGGFAVMDKDIWVPELIDIARSGFVVARCGIAPVTKRHSPPPSKMSKRPSVFCGPTRDNFALTRKKSRLGANPLGGI